MSKLGVAVIKGVSMAAYIGTKLVNAKPMTRGEYNDFRGWELPKDEDGSDKGYLVEYIDGGKANTAEYAGYVSWSPADVFARGYKASGSLSFSEALIALKAGHRVARTGWNGSDQWLSAPNTNVIKAHADQFWSGNNHDYAKANGGFVEIPPYITIKNAQGQVQIGWVPSQGDLFANDWVILEKTADFYEQAQTAT